MKKSILIFIIFLTSCSTVIVFEGHEYIKDKNHMIYHKEDCKFCKQRKLEAERTEQERNKARQDKTKEWLEKSRKERLWRD